MKHFRTRITKGAETTKTLRRSSSVHLTTMMIVLVFAAGAGSVGGTETLSMTYKYTCALQVGQYDAYEVYEPYYTGLMREDGSTIGAWDDPSAFEEPDHVKADFLWFTSGWMLWAYPLEIPTGSTIGSMSYTVEISSEFPGYQTDWPSVIDVTINGVYIATWTIPGDPGYDSYGNDRYGLQENHLGAEASQYGWLCTWTVDETGTYFEYQFTEGDMVRTKISDIKVEDLIIIPGETVDIGLFVCLDGGINIYGDTWGDYNFDPQISVIYAPFIEVTIDIKPGSDPNPINPGSNGLVPVAILSSEDFDARTVDPTTVELAGATVALRGKGNFMAHEEDVDEDGLVDLVVQVETQGLGDLGTGGTVKLTGTTFDGRAIVGYDDVVIVPPEE